MDIDVHSLLVVRIARNKLGDMDKNGFEDIIVAEFAPQFQNQKQLARELRSTTISFRLEP
jgi:hypothetical protein